VSTPIRPLPDELRAAVLAEQYAHTPAADHGQVLAAWTEREQARHRAELLAAIGEVASSQHRTRTQRAIIDDLPPGPGPTLVVRGRS
jgi:hypothetical protein